MKKLLLWALALALTVGGAAVLYKNLAPGAALPTADPQPPAAEQPAAGTEQPAPEEPDDRVAAPDFTVYDKDGNAFTLADFAGKPVLLNFWATWCGYCKQEMADLNTVYGEYKDSVYFLIVDMTDGTQETVEKANQYIADNGYSFPAYYDTAGSAAYAYGVTALPTTVFLDAEGYISASYRGMLNADTFRDNLDAAGGAAAADETEVSLPG